MDSVCDRVIRCLCFCLIKKDQVSYDEVNEEKSKFMSVSEHNDDDANQGPPPLAEDSLSEKIDTYLTEEQRGGTPNKASRGKESSK